MADHKNKSLKNNKLLRKKISIPVGPSNQPQQIPYADLYNHCVSLCNDQQYYPARNICEQIVRQLPRELEPKILLATIYQGMNDHTAMSGLCAELLQKFPATASVLNRVAGYYSMVNMPEKSVELLEKAVQIQPRSSVINTALAISYMETGAREKALSHFDKAIAIDPINANAIWSKTLMSRGEVKSRQLRHIEDALSAGQCSDSAIAQLHFAAAFAYRRDDIEREMQHLQKANQLASLNRPFNPESEAKIFRSFRNFFGKELIEGIQATRDIEAQPIFIAAMPRSGTTLLEQILTSHSSIDSIGESDGMHHAEMAARRGNIIGAGHWFQEKPEAIQRFLAFVQDQYESHPLVAVAGDHRTLDKSISNVAYAALIATVYPRARIIYLKRDPMDVVLSCYQYYFPYGHNYIFDLEHTALEYRLFDDWLQYLQSIVPEMVLTVSYEELTSKPVATVDKILAFCGLQPESAVFEFDSQQRGLRSDVMKNTGDRIYTSAQGRWKPYAEYLAPAAAILEVDIATV